MEASALLHFANNESVSNLGNECLKCCEQLVPNGSLKRRGRPSKVIEKNGFECSPIKQSKVTDTMKKAKRSVDRFNGLTKEELMQRSLPDRIKAGLDILIIGINPGLVAAYEGHHYAGPGNHFWKCLYASGLIPEPLTPVQDYLAPNYGIGLTNIVERTTSGSKDLSSKEIQDGGVELIEKIQRHKPKIAVFNGKGIYEIFSKTVFGQKKKDFCFGAQPNKIPGTDTHIFVMPSTSARCAQFPRATDKVHFFIQLKHLRDQLRGFPATDDVIDLAKATEAAKTEAVKEERNENEQGPYLRASRDQDHQPPDPPPHDDKPGCSKTVEQVSLTKPPLRKVKPPRKVNSAKGRPGFPASKNLAGHPHLVKFLRDSENADEEQPVPANDPFPALRPSMVQMRQTVSDDQRNRRVGLWVRTQIDQQYDSDPPMGFDERLRAETASQPGSDHSSQRSLVSAGVSGSASTGSTSGYGSVDTNIHHAQRDRVEMWVREQQYVRQHVLPPHDARQNRNQSLHPPHADRDDASPADVAGISPHLPPPPAASEHDSTADVTPRPPVPLFRNWGGCEPDGHPPVADDGND